MLEMSVSYDLLDIPPKHLRWFRVLPSVRILAADLGQCKRVINSPAVGQAVPPVNLRSYNTVISACDGERWELATGQVVNGSQTLAIRNTADCCLSRTPEVRMCMTIRNSSQTDSQAKTTHVSIVKKKMMRWRPLCPNARRELTARRAACLTILRHMLCQLTLVTLVLA